MVERPVGPTRPGPERRKDTMHKRRVAVGLVLLTALAVPAAGDGIHLPGGRSTGFNWQLNDGAGYRWDISSQGYVNDGTNDAYDGGMRLSVNGSNFSHGGSGKLSKDGREVEIGPWQHGKLRVYRRIRVAPKDGWCRWIDLFENTGGGKATIKVRYYTDTGGSIQQIRTTTGKATVGKKDWGFVTSNPGDSHRPALVHYFATRGGKVRPTVQVHTGNDNLYYNFSLDIPAGKTVALCLVEAQRRPDPEALEMIEQFKVASVLSDVPSELKRIIVNMGGGLLTLANIELPRSDRHDLAVRVNGDELVGDILNDRFVVETFYGRLDLPAGRVIGVSIPDAESGDVQVVLTDGQIIAGTLDNAPLRMRLTNGNELALSPTDLKTAAFRISAERPAQVAAVEAMLVLRSGQRLVFDVEQVDYTFHTEYGEVQLDPSDLAMLLFDTPDAGLHRAVFTNGSVLSGLLVTPTVRTDLSLGPTLEVPRPAVSMIRFPTVEREPQTLATVVLRNDDRLVGRLTDPILRIHTRYDVQDVAAADFAALERADESPERVRVSLRGGTTLTGRPADETLGFAVEPGPELELFIGHVVSIDNPPGAVPAPAAGTTTRPTTAPATRATTAPATRATTRRATRASAAGASEGVMAREATQTPEQRNAAELRELMAQIEKLQKKLAEVAAAATQTDEAERKAELQDLAQKLIAQRTALEQRRKELQAAMKTGG